MNLLIPVRAGRVVGRVMGFIPREAVLASHLAFDLPLPSQVPYHHNNIPQTTYSRSQAITSLFDPLILPPPIVALRCGRCSFINFSAGDGSSLDKGHRLLTFFSPNAQLKSQLQRKTSATRLFDSTVGRSLGRSAGSGYSRLQYVIRPGGLSHTFFLSV